MEFFERFKSLCKEKNVSQRKVEKDLGLGNAATSKWKNSSPSMDVLLKLSSYFNISVDYLMKGDYEEDPNILRFEAALDNSIDLLEKAGYLVSFSDNKYKNIVNICDKSNTLIVSMDEDDLVIKYESLLRTGKLSAESLIETPEALLVHYNRLNETGKKEAEKRVEELTYISKYTTTEPVLNAAHERTDIEVTDEMQKHDDDIIDDDNY